ncbi:hypothetical protein [Kitasatospora sp. NPDC088134]|uniref:hypothetical protein n=1 Tax=Kitasatospora sp. NPDC088134 TaxID=3364071 RepID=UPI00382B1564
MGITGFERVPLVGLAAVRAAHGARLAALAGRRLTGFAVVRFAEDGDGYADCPVVLEFDGRQVEICHWKLDELHLGWDAIDTSAPITGWEWFELTPVWSRTDDRLAPFLGRQLLETALLEWRPTDRRDLAAGTVAVEFTFTDGSTLRIVNGLDENLLASGPPDPQYHRHPLPAPDVPDVPDAPDVPDVPPGG